jgi:membrane protease YdiL (CAAX protease family)
MKPQTLFSLIITHIAAVSIVALFCFVNSNPAALAGKLPETHDLFTALLQGQFISLPLMLFPVILTIVLPGSRETIKAWFARPTCTFRGGLWAFFLMLLFSNALLIAIAPPEQQPIVAMFQCLQGWQVAVIASFICIIVPVVEELLFRGVLMRGLPCFFALFYSAVIFASAHGINDYVLPLFFTGWLLGLIRLKSESLIPSMCCHAAFNTISLLLATFA